MADTETTNGTPEVDWDALSEKDELSEEDYLAIMAGGREKGIYDDELLDYIRSNKLGKPYKFSGKKAMSVKTGFESAKGRLKEGKSTAANVTEDEQAIADYVEVRIRGEKVFLLRGDLAKAAKASA
jgi:hypothetical protein